MSSGRRFLPGPPEWNEEIQSHRPDSDSWLIVYLDVITLMLSLFVMMLAYASHAPEDYQRLSRAIAQQAHPLDEPEQPARQTEPVQMSTEIREGTQEGDPHSDLQQVQQAFHDRLQEQDLQGLIEMTMEPNRINLQINERILFDPGRADLTDSGRSVLARLVVPLNAGDGDISVEGHTDSIPIANKRFPSNWELSTQRATRVLRYLLAEGVSKPLRAIGYADTRPVAGNDTTAGRSRNRRVSLVIHLGEQ